MLVAGLVFHGSAEAARCIELAARLRLENLTKVSTELDRQSTLFHDMCDVEYSKASETQRARMSFAFEFLGFGAGSDTAKLKEAYKKECRTDRASDALRYRRNDEATLVSARALETIERCLELDKSGFDIQEISIADATGTLTLVATWKGKTRATFRGVRISSAGSDTVKNSDEAACLVVAESGDKVEAHTLGPATPVGLRPNWSYLFTCRRKLYPKSRSNPAHFRAVTVGFDVGEGRPFSIDLPALELLEIPMYRLKAIQDRLVSLEQQLAATRQIATEADNRSKANANAMVTEKVWYRIVTALPHGKDCFDVDTNGRNVQAYFCNNANGQRFRLARHPQQ